MQEIRNSFTAYEIPDKLIQDKKTSGIMIVFKSTRDIGKETTHMDEIR